jgi:hypothetical protein
MRASRLLRPSSCIDVATAAAEDNDMVRGEAGEFGKAAALGLR